jgi:hypothetical protein
MQQETSIHGFCLELQVVCLYAAYELFLPAYLLHPPKSLR